MLVRGELVMLLVFLACDPKPPCYDALDDVLPSLAGPGAIDCGTADLYDDPVRVDECVVEAFQNGDPFRAEYQWREIGTYGTEGWASDGTAVWKVDFSDSWSAAGSVSYAECIEPTIGEQEEDRFGEISVRQVLACGDLGPPEDVRCQGY